MAGTRARSRHAGLSSGRQGRRIARATIEHRYQAALERLAESLRVYSCDCSRKEIAGESDVPDQETRYPGRCRDRNLSPGPGRGLRVMMEAGEERFDDGLLGPQSQDPSRQCGDLLLKDRHGNWTYQFAVTVDDLDQEIDLVIRGQDLLESTGRQIRLARMLGRAAPPAYLHHPLIRHGSGAKLSKANRDTGIRELRAAGFTPAAVLGQAAHRAGLIDSPRDLDGSGLGSLLSTELASTMPRTGRWLAAGLFLCALAPGRGSAQLPRVMIQTELGSMEVEVDTIKTPDAAGDFLIYVDHGAYQGGRFHRTVRAERQAEGKTEIEGIQGGLNPSRSKDVAPMALNGKKDTGLSLGDKASSTPPDGMDEANRGFFHSRRGSARTRTPRSRRPGVHSVRSRRSRARGGSPYPYGASSGAAVEPADWDLEYYEGEVGRKDGGGRRCGGQVRRR